MVALPAYLVTLCVSRHGSHLSGTEQLVEQPVRSGVPPSEANRSVMARIWTAARIEHEHPVVNRLILPQQTQGIVP